jgi:hypothetical protein
MWDHSSSEMHAQQADVVEYVLHADCLTVSEKICTQFL